MILNNVIFREKDHTYLLNEKRLISVTQKISKYVPKFNTEKVSSKYSEKNNLPVDYVLQKWDDQRNLGTELGNWVHLNVEGRLKNKELDLDYLITKEPTALKKLVKEFYLDNYKTQINNYIKMIKESKSKHLGSEIIVSNGNVAGQIDHLLNTHIDDFKNDKEIEYTNFYQKFKSFLSHLDYCNWNKYRLQISLYHLLLPENIREQFTQPHRIVKFNRYSENFELLDLPLLLDEAKEILNDK